MSVEERILRLRRNILVHSCLYYHFDTNLISDFQYDSMGKELVKFQQDFPNESKNVDYYDDFKDYGLTGCYSGFDLPFMNDEIVRKAEQLLQLQT